MEAPYLEEEVRWEPGGCNRQRPVPAGLLLPARPHLLRFLQPFKIESLSGSRHLKHELVWDISALNHSIKCLTETSTYLSTFLPFLVWFYMCIKGQRCLQTLQTILIKVIFFIQCVSFPPLHTPCQVNVQVLNHRSFPETGCFLWLSFKISGFLCSKGA